MCRFITVLSLAGALGLSALSPTFAADFHHDFAQLSPTQQNNAQIRSVYQRELNTLETEIRVMIERGETPPQHMMKRRDNLRLQIQRLR